jgi:hypothetical protein
MAGEELGNALNKHILLYLPDYLTNYTGPDLFGNPAPMWFNRPPTSLKMYRRRSASKKGRQGVVSAERCKKHLDTKIGGEII